MNPFESLLTALAHAKQLRVIRKHLHAAQAKVRKTARGKFWRRSRLSRSRWITESQKQALVVAADRKAAREAGDLISHLKRYYPAHNHGKART